MPPTTPSTSTPLRPRADRMKDSILKESSAGWTNAGTTPLRIAKRDHLSPSSSSSPNPAAAGPTRVVARRSSNSYKHVFNNNLVSRSPFKSQLAPRQTLGGGNVANSPRPAVPIARKISGEKRPRPESLVQQAEHENTQRVSELGYKRRQSRGFQGLVEKNPVTKSPFRQFMSPGRAKKDEDFREVEMQREEEVNMNVPIAIEFPSKGDDTTSPETTETDSSLNSREGDTRPRTPPKRATPPRFSPSPGFERRSPVPSALQGSPARPSLVQKPRLLGPRSRSLSTGASGAPIAEVPSRRERRKTVTFDERCDVVEFDRESCEDAVFDTDDENVYGKPEPQGNQSQDMSPEASQYFDAVALDDSINGLVDSMLQEQEVTSLSEPSTPETNTASLSSIVTDTDLMPGGAEDGVPLGRTHHVERVREHQHEMNDIQPQLPAIFPSDETASFTPPWQEHADPQTPRAHAIPTYNSCGEAPLPSLPPDTECAEDGMPLGRTHHAERARTAHESGEDFDVKMLPPSPSPIKKATQSGSEHELPGTLLPKFDLGLDSARTSSPHRPTKEGKSTHEDVFGLTNTTHDILAELEFEHPDIDADLLSNTSIASFHEFPPQPGSDYEVEGNADLSQQRSRDISFGGRSDRSLDAIVSKLRLREEQAERDSPHEARQEDEYARTEAGEATETVSEPGTQGFRETEEGIGRHTSSLVDQDRSTDFGPQSPKHHGLYMQTDVGSSASLTGSDGRRSRSPRITREDVLRKLNRQRSSENCNPLGTPPLASSVSSMPKVEESTREDVTIGVDELMNLPPTPSWVEKPHPRPPLEERLKRALSPGHPEPAHVRSAVVRPMSPASPSPSRDPVTPPLARDANYSCGTPPILSPPRVGDNGRAHTYDFDERPPSAPAKIVAPRSPMSSSFDFNQPGVDIAEMDMRSALERLVDDVSIAGGVEPISTGSSGRGNADVDRSGVTASDGDVSMADTELITEESTELLASLREPVNERPQLQRAGTAPFPTMSSISTPERPPIPHSVSEVSMTGGSSAVAFHEVALMASGSGLGAMRTSSNVPPPVPPKTPEKSARQAREDMIRERRREARARESGEYFVPPRRDAAGNLLEESPAGRRRTSSRPSMGRSMSTGDAEDMLNEGPSTQRRVSALRKRRGGVLGVALDDDEDMLSDSIERELKKRDDPKKTKTYELREPDAVVYASSSQEESMARLNQSLDVEDKAWRTVRRPSDMDEYARQIKEIRAQEKPSKSHGKVFVKVIKLRGISVPLPPQHTMFSCTLNNGIHYVTTPECRLTREARIDQEFELIEHAKLEFTLTLKVRRDPHILQQFKAISPPVLPLAQAMPSPTHRGVRSFFGGTPKKPKMLKHNRAQTEPVVRFEIEENLARYMKQDGTLARAFVAFKDIARHCDTRLFESAFPLFGQRLEAPGEGGGAGGTMVPKQIGEIILQIFRLPPLPGIPQSQLPQSLDDCHRGLRHISWHKVTYHEGVLTQLGGDCSTWRRRQLRVIGGNLVAFNDVTKRAMATIDLKKTIAVEDDQDPKNASKHRDVDDFDAMYGVERSFRLVFPHNQEITFFADTDEEKSRWLEVFRALVGHIPPHQLWAELVWQKLNEAPKSTQQQSSTS